jgi:hypothetical protein
MTLGMLRCNTLDTATGGSALFAYSSCLNHSPAPNARVIHDGSVRGAHCIVVATRDIAEGEEVTIDLRGSKRDCWIGRLPAGLAPRAGTGDSMLRSQSGGEWD